MTAIVGLVHGNRVYIGGDSLGSNSYTKTEYVEPKVFHNGEFLIGYTSTFRFGEIVEHLFVPPERGGNSGSDKAYLVSKFIPALRACLEESKYTAESHEGRSGVALIGYQGHLYKLQDDFSILENTAGYDATGSGEEVALGSLYTSYSLVQDDPEFILRTALSAAGHHVPSVGGRSNVLWI